MIKWGNEGFGHQCGIESLHKFLAKYKGILCAKEINETRGKKTEIVYYIEDLAGEYKTEWELKNAIDRIKEQTK